MYSSATVNKGITIMVYETSAIKDCDLDSDLEIPQEGIDSDAG